MTVWDFKERINNVYISATRNNFYRQQEEGDSLKKMLVVVPARHW